MAQLPVLNNQQQREHLGGISGTGGPIWDAERERIAEGLSGLLATGSGTNRTGGEVRFGRHDRLLYSTDASLYQVEPIGVVVPASVDDAARIVQWCSDRRVAMLPRGGGTSLAGQCTNRAVVIDMSASCRAVRHVDTRARLCDVEPGLSIESLNDHLVKNETGLFFAPDPATVRQCAIGGAIGNNAAGARSILYGRTSENVESVEVALANRIGERVRLGPGTGRHDAIARRLGDGVLQIVRANAAVIRERFPRTIRRNAGYGLDMILDQAERGATPETVDLSKLLCGSEGTLALTLSATLKLHPLPKFKGLVLIAFESVDAAIEAVQPILKTGPSAVELLDDVVLDAARGNEECRRYLAIMPSTKAPPSTRGSTAGTNASAILYVEYFAFESADELKAKFAALRTTLAGRTPADSIREHTDGPSMAKAWALRKAGEPLLHGMPGSRKPITFVEDNAVPVERLGEFVREFRKIVTKHGTRAAYWAHASVGVLHVRPMIDIHDPGDRERLRAIAVEVADLARACGGIMSGEHGDGRVRGPLLERFFGPELMRAFRDIKRLFDPLNLLNPGNIADPGPVESITAHLRVDEEHGSKWATGHGSAPNAVDTYFNYDDAEGFGHAVEQCNGAGVCRKRGGVMCPSYQATLDERHSTRGRGNALRLAITGQFPKDMLSKAGDQPNWSDPETIRTLDLCLSCKACKSECPSNVDIARLKAEYAAQRYRVQKRVPLAALATGHVRILNRLGAIAPGLASATASSSLGRAIVNRIIRIHPDRSLPRFSRSLYRAFVPEARAAGTPVAVIFTDCFTTYNESSVGVAAGQVLEKLGYQVRLSGSHCCGRSMISVGMLPQAIGAIDHALEALRPAIEDDNVRGIVVCEPSCLSAIKDDWLALKCESPLDLRKKLAAKAMLPEEFIERFWHTHPTSPTDIQFPSSDILFHAHCHQKSLWSAESSAALLRRLVGDKLKVLDTGCCGMAGSFGFDRDKFDVSMKIGELSLLPIVREAPEDAIVVATGTSCRHQIHDGAHRRALHPIELVAQLFGC